MQKTIDPIIKSDIRICQPENGFRFGVDSVYLAWFAQLSGNKRIVDIGSGSGVITALLVKLKGIKQCDAVEMQPVMFNCLDETVGLCEIQNNVKQMNIDIRSYRPDFQYDGAVCNPPYRDPSSGRVPTDETELNARFTTTLTADDIFSFCRSFLKFGAGLFLSYDADMMPVLFESANKFGFEAKRLMPVCPDINVKPKVILMEFRKGGKRELSFEAPLYQKINGVPSPMHENIFSGEWI
ncbi:methyltransferase [Seleniivibrio sp.]|uniref:tRNA1(Val) (adenine(37)-N6)-methyltransferase n=1 Tax=Seleniivibrio sp. TaxID=2898801 RepID=UPI0025FBB034|nr:methyltransferase [Seleniivibrio sp.]MCD8552782.1 methyltransferase [Seleniivibrio sp.]